MRPSALLFAATISATITSSMVVLSALALASFPVQDDEPRAACVQNLPTEVRTRSLDAVPAIDVEFG